MRGQVDLEPSPTLPGAFEEFFAEERQALFGSIWLVTRDRGEAEEIVQEAFLKVWERWDRVRSMKDPTGYLFRTAMNLWRSRRRRAALAVRRVVRTASVYDGIADVDSRDAVIRALARLTPRQRAAIVLTDLLGFTSAEAARALGARP